MRRVVADLSTRIGIEGGSQFVTTLRQGADAMKGLGTASTGYVTAAQAAAAASAEMAERIRQSQKAAEEAARAQVTAAEEQGRAQVEAAREALRRAEETAADDRMEWARKVRDAEKRFRKATDERKRATGSRAIDAEERFQVAKGKVERARDGQREFTDVGRWEIAEAKRGIAAAEEAAKRKVEVAKTTAQIQIDEARRVGAAERAAMAASKLEMARQLKEQEAARKAAARQEATEEANRVKTEEAVQRIRMRFVPKRRAAARKAQAAVDEAAFNKWFDGAMASAKGNELDPEASRADAARAREAADQALAAHADYMSKSGTRLKQALARAKKNSELPRPVLKSGKESKSDKGLPFDPVAVEANLRDQEAARKEAVDRALAYATALEKVAAAAEKAAAAQRELDAAAAADRKKEWTEAWDKYVVDLRKRQAAATKIHQQAAAAAAKAQQEAAQRSADAWKRFAEARKALPSLLGTRPGLGQRLADDGALSVLGGIAGRGVGAAVGLTTGVIGGVVGLVTGAIGLTARLAAGIVGVGVSAVKAGGELALWLGTTVTSVLGKVLGVVGQVAGAVAGLAAKLAKVAVVGGAGLVVAGAGIAKKATGDAGQAALDNDNARLGTGATSMRYQIMAAAAKDAGVEVSDLNEALKATRKATLEAINDPRSDIGQYFERTGVQVLNAYGQLRSTDAILQDLIVRSRQLNGIDQLNFLEKVVGDPERFYRLSPLIQQMADPNRQFVAKAGAKADRLGVLQGPEALAQARAYKSAVNDVGDAWLGVKIKIAEAVGDDVVAGMNKLALRIAATGPLIARVFRFGFDEAQKIIADIGGVWQEGFAYADRAESRVSQGALYAAQAVRDLYVEVRAAMAGDDAAVQRFPWIIAVRDGIQTAIETVRRFGQEVKAAVMDDGSISNFRFPWLKAIGDGVRSAIEEIKLQWGDLRRVFDGQEAMYGLGQWLQTAMGYYAQGKAALTAFVSEVKLVWADLQRVWDHKPGKGEQFNFAWIKKIGEDVWWMAENFKKAWEMFQSIFKVFDNTVKLFSFGNLNGQTLILIGTLATLLGVTRTVMALVSGSKAAWGVMAGSLERMGALLAGGAAAGGGAVAAGGLVGGMTRMGDAVKASGGHAVEAAGKWDKLKASLGGIGGALQGAMGGFQAFAAANPRLAGALGLGAGVAAGVGGYLLSEDAKEREGWLGTAEATAGGALQGAAMGAMIGGLPGAAVGGALGGAAGYWTHRSAAEAAERERRAKVEGASRAAARERLGLPADYDINNPAHVEAARKAGEARRKAEREGYVSGDDSVLYPKFFDSTQAKEAPNPGSGLWGRSPQAQPAPATPGPQAGLAPLVINLADGERVEGYQTAPQRERASRLADLKSARPDWEFAGAYA